MAYWRDYVHLYEVSDASYRLPKPMRPGIFYAARKITNRAQLLSDIENRLQFVMDHDVSPTGFVYGRMTDGTIGESYPWDEFRSLDEHFNLIMESRDGQTGLFGCKLYGGTNWDSGYLMLRRFAWDNEIYGPFRPRYPTVQQPVVPAEDHSLHQAMRKTQFMQTGFRLP